jgi:hypothetical protein
MQRRKCSRCHWCYRRYWRHRRFQYFSLRTSPRHIIDTRNDKLSWGSWEFSEHSLWIKRKQAGRGPSGSNVLLCQSPVPCRTVQIGKVFFAYCVYASSIESVDLIAIGRLQRGEWSDVTGLELMGSVRCEKGVDKGGCYLQDKTPGSRAFHRSQNRRRYALVVYQ